MRSCLLTLLSFLGFAGVNHEGDSRAGPVFHPTMQKSLERALGRAEHIIESAQKRPPKRQHPPGGGKSLHEKLYDIYVEECGKEPEVAQELRSNVNLLEKLMARESLSCLVVNLYPGKEGYSLMLKGKNGSYSETIRLPYEEGELLEYLDAEELPPVLVDLLEKCPVNMFHCGCVIAEIRDYRQSSNREAPGYQSRHILLRPTMQTLACDVQSITSDDQKWTQEDKLLLESQLILATAEPLCLEPCVSVACTENRLLYNKQKMNANLMRRSLKRYSAASLSRRQELRGRPPSPELRVPSTSYEESKESEAGQQYDLGISQAGNSVDAWKQRPCALAVPSEVDVEKYAKGERSGKHDDSQPTVWPAHQGKDGSVFACEAGDGSQTRKPTFAQPGNDPLISGKRSRPKKIRCERQISSCHSSTHDHLYSSMPGSNTNAGRVVSRSEESVPKNTKCPVKMSHSSRGSAGLRKIFPKKEAEQPQARSAQSSALGKGVQHTPPATKLPWSSGKSLSGNRFTPQQASSLPKPSSSAPASEPPGLAQKSSVEVNQVSTPPAASLFTVSSSLQALLTLVKDSRVVSPVARTQTVVRRSNPVQRSTTGAGDPSGVNPSSLPSGGQPPNAQPTAPQAPSQTGVQYILNTASELRPLTLLQVPEGSVILNTQQQSQQPQQCQQQWVYQLVPQQQPQRPTTFHLQQPVVLQGSSVQVSTSQVTALPAQQAVLINLSGVESFVQPQATVLSQRGFAQTGPGQTVPQQTVLLCPVLQQQPQPQPQQVQLRIVQHMGPVATAAAQAAQPGGGQQTASQSKGKMNRGPPSTPNS